jgi:WD40 repeat protein
MANPHDGADDRPEVEFRPNAYREANVLHTAFFGRPLRSSSSSSSSSSSAANDVNDSPPSYAKKGEPSPQKNDLICTKVITSPKNERICMGGHKEVIFGLSFSHDGKYMATASQDSTICIWDVASHRLKAKLSEGNNIKFECLRVAWMGSKDDEIPTSAGRVREKYLLASAGADGIVRLWSATIADGSSDGGVEVLIWKSAGELDHYLWEKNEALDDVESSIEDDDKEEEDRPQIYGLQFVHSKAALPKMNILLVSTNDYIYLWNIAEDGDEGGNINLRRFLHLLSIRFTNLNDGVYEANNFGGPRNPDNKLFVFDAQYSESNDFLGAALSDGTCRVISLHDGDEGPFYQERCVLGLPPGYFGTKGGHLTSLSWDQSGTRLATCIGSGRVVLWLLQLLNKNGVEELHPACLSVLEGGEICCGLFPDIILLELY